MKLMSEARLKELLTIAYDSGWKHRGMLEKELKVTKPEYTLKVVDSYLPMGPGVVLTLVSQA